jgi:hypothetical protein
LRKHAERSPLSQLYIAMALRVLSSRCDRSGFSAPRVAVPLLYPLAQYTEVSGQPLSPDELLRLCDALKTAGTDVLLLRKVREDSGLFEALSQHGQSQRAKDLAYYIDLEAHGTFAKYDALFSARTRRNRRQRMQKLEQQAGSLSFEVLRGEDAAQAFNIASEWKRRWALAKRHLEPRIRRRVLGKISYERRFPPAPSL